MSVSLVTQEYTTQRDGSRHVVERYVDHLGVQYMRTYFIDGNANLAQRVTDYIPVLEAQLAESEINELLNNG